MKVIIAGSRNLNDYNVVARAAAESGMQITEVVSGGARGVDRLGELWAKRNGLPVRRFPADWDRYGKSAGYRRNEEMGRYADALVACWDGVSRGTKHMIDFMRRLGKPVHVHIVR